MRDTKALFAVAVALMANPHGRHYGYPLGKATGLRSGAMYPLLSRLLEAGWLGDGWEEHAEAKKAKRPPRRYYELTELGMRELGALAARAPRSAPAQTSQRLQGGMA